VSPGRTISSECSALLKRPALRDRLTGSPKEPGAYVAESWGGAFRPPPLRGAEHQVHGVGSPDASLGQDQSDRTCCTPSMNETGARA
jgi:hypothetical protein